MCVWPNSKRRSPVTGKGEHKVRNLGLTLREREVMHLICDGLTPKEIALHLGVSLHTVKSHLKGAHRKLGARNGKHAVALFLEGRR